MEREKHAYSVWGIPPEEVKNRVNKLMTGLRSEYGGPEIEPHITVVKAITLSHEEALLRFKSACTDLKAFPVTTNGFGFASCLKLLFHSTPQAVATSGHCYSHFGSNQPPNYAPQMSLLYADLTEEEKKKSLEKAGLLDDSISNLSFTVNRLALYITDEDKTLKSWRKVAECELESV